MYIYFFKQIIPRNRHNKPEGFINKLICAGQKFILINRIQNNFVFVFIKSVYYTYTYYAYIYILTIYLLCICNTQLNCTKPTFLQV